MIAKFISIAALVISSVLLTGCLTYSPEPFPIDEYNQQLSKELAEQRALNTALKQRIAQLESNLSCEAKLP